MLWGLRPITVMLGILGLLVVPGLGAAQEKNADVSVRDASAATELAAHAIKAAPAASIEGSWIYLYASHLTSQTMIFTFAKQPGGSLKATIDFPESRRQQHFNSVTFKDGRVQIKELFGTVLVFEATLRPDGKSLDGRVKMGGDWVPLTLGRLDESPTFRRPQEPQRPYPYAEEAVTFVNAEAGLRLAGTLTLPSGTGPHPAVVLLSGSGADDRDCLAGGHYPFLVLADYLTRRGVAVLRCDDRGVGKSQGDFARATTDDFARDAQAAVDFLRGRKEIDPQRIGLLGHSNGGACAARVAGRSPEVAFVVLLGAQGVSGGELIVRQTERGLKALGANEARVRWNVDVQKRVVEVLKRETDPARIDRLLQELVAEVNAALTDADRERMGVGKAFRLDGVAGGSAWLRDLVNNDPRPTLAKVRCPVLALNGDRDVLVDARDNLAEIERALRSGGNQDVTIRELPGLNHLFQTCEAGVPAEYPWIEETIAPSVLELVGDWITRHTSPH